MNDFNQQEEFWSGKFGDEYINRNRSEQLLASNLNYFSKALKCAGDIRSAIEFGANVGMNLKALKMLFPEQHQYGVEINKKAAEHLANLIGLDNVFNDSMFKYESKIKYDLSFTKGVLIHIDPDMLQNAYQLLYDSSKKYILMGEYYNPKPVMIDYRGHSEKLYKRDFCGEILAKYSNLNLIDYGFCYKKDPAFPQDDITWFLLEKTNIST